MGTAHGLQARGPGDFRGYLPRFTGENRERNERLVEALQKLAAEKGIRPSQLAIAWALARGRNIIPVIGARTLTLLVGSLGALEIRLSPAELALIEAAVPPSGVAGARYDAAATEACRADRSFAVASLGRTTCIWLKKAVLCGATMSPFATIYGPMPRPHASLPT